MNMQVQKPSFNEIKATGLASYFLKLAGGSMNKMKLIKLMYLVDRASFCEMGKFVTNDDFYSLPYGPFLSHTADLINEQKRIPSIWNRHITPPADYKVKLTKCSHKEVINSLSEYEIELAKTIFEQYGDMDRWELVKLLHKILPEWSDPGEGNRSPINLQDILSSCGKTEQEQKEIFAYLAEQALQDRFWK